MACSSDDSATSQSSAQAAGNGGVSGASSPAQPGPSASGGMIAAAPRAGEGAAGREPASSMMPMPTAPTPSGADDAGVDAPPQAGSGASTAGPAAAAGGLAPELCSGCSSEMPDALDMTIHLHHVHLNTADSEISKSFYETHLAAERVTLNGVTEALHAAPILLLLDEATQPPVSSLPTALQHIGWGAQDPAAWYDKAHAAGVAPDTRGNTFFTTNETPTVGEPGSGASTFELLGAEPPACFPVPDRFSYMYVLGPDQERIEIWSGIDERVNHLHFTTADLTTTVSWYEQFLAVPMVGSSALFASFFLDDLLFFFEPVGSADVYLPTDDHVLAHVAFSVTDLDAWAMRAQQMQIEVVAPPAEAHGFKSFFVRGPDGMLIELVQAAPSKELCLDGKSSSSRSAGAQ